MILKAKPSFEEFIQTCTPLLKIPALEEAMRARVRGIVADLLNFRPNADPAKNLKQFLQRDENFLGVLLALTNLSQEKFLRILSAQRFSIDDYGPEWKIKTIYGKIQKDDDFAERIARLFLEGRSNQLLIEQVADFYLDQLSLPSNWSDVIRDQNVIENIIRKKLTGEYTDLKGKYVEGMIREWLNMLQEKYGVPHAHGQVKLVGKEVDHAIPSLDEPFVMIMASYMETTSSGQTARANEQRAMMNKVRDERDQYAVNRGFINVIDGTGWLARRSDLKKMHASCDHCLNIKTLAQLEEVVCHYVPAKFFTKRPRPEVRKAP